jgi:hypothetical protein
MLFAYRFDVFELVLTDPTPPSQQGWLLSARIL